MKSHVASVTTLEVAPPVSCGVPFLDRVEPSLREALMRLGFERLFPDAAPVLTRDVDTETVGVIVGGLVTITGETDRNGRTAILGVHRRGDLLGLLEQSRVPAPPSTLTARGPTLVRFWSHEQFRELLETFPVGEDSDA